MRHAYGNSGGLKEATGCRQGALSILLLATMTVGEILAFNSNELISRDTHQHDAGTKLQGGETRTDELRLEMNQLAKSAQESCDRGQHKQAEFLYRKAMSIGESTLGPDDPNAANLLNNLAFTLRSQARYAEAEALYRKALGIHQRVSGSQHPAVAAVLNNLGEIARHQGRFADAGGNHR